MAGDDHASRGATHPLRPTLRRGALPRDHGGAVLRAPRGTDEQTLHTRDELYVVPRGSGTFANGDRRHPFPAGDELFIPAGRCPTASRSSRTTSALGPSSTVPKGASGRAEYEVVGP